MAIDIVGAGNWQLYKDLMRDAQETFAKQTITWLRSRGGLDRFAEDNVTERFDTITLEVLIQYNIFRTWPITATSDQGQIDKESVVIYMNKEYLEENNWLTTNNNFKLDAAADRFIIDGITHIAMGNTDVAQDHSDPLWVIVILKRDKDITAAPNP
jgi:hypothetical protein